MSNNILTASRINSFQTCARQHYWRYEIGLQSDSESLALFIGSAWHRAMEARAKGKSAYGSFAAAWPENTTGDAYTAEKISALIQAYYDIYGPARSDEPMESEKQFSFPLKGVKGFTVEGKIDFISGRKLDEYKTTGESIAPDSTYWLRLRFNTQILQYVLAARELGYVITEIHYDVTRKPSIAPKIITDTDGQGRKIVNNSAGERVFNEKGKFAGEPRQSGDKERGFVLMEHLETPEEFGMRLYEDCMARPDFYFARREIPVLDDDLTDFIAQRLAIAKTIIHHRKLENKSARPEFAWPRHVSADTCVYCQFKNFCLQNINVDPAQPPQGFAVKAFNPELATEAGV